MNSGDTTEETFIINLQLMADNNQTEVDILVHCLKPLYTASFIGHADVVKLLLDSDAFVMAG